MNKRLALIISFIALSACAKQDITPSALKSSSSTVNNLNATDVGDTNVESSTQDLVTASETIPVYRLYSGKDHMDSWSADEASASYKGEGMNFILLTKYAVNRAPVYRCVVVASNEHFLSNAADCEGHKLEYNLGFASTVPLDGMVPLYRNYNATTGDHLATLVSTEGHSGGYVTEGVLGYVYHP